MDPVPYVEDGGLNGSGVLDVARQVQLRIKHWGYAWKMSNDTKWVDRTWLELQVCNGRRSNPRGGTATDRALVPDRLRQLDHWHLLRSHREQLEHWYGVFLYWRVRSGAHVVFIYSSLPRSWGGASSLVRGRNLFLTQTMQFTAAFALGYDWFYDAWTTEQRTAIMSAGLLTTIPIAS